MKSQQTKIVKCLFAILLCWACSTELSVADAFTFTPQSTRFRQSFNGCSPTTTCNLHCAVPNTSVSETENGSTTSRGGICDNKKAIQPSPIGMLASALAIATTVLFTAASPVMADEYGVEKEAPTVFTGETVLICTKRGPLGACLATEQRTAENDNDKSLKYFQDPSEVVKRKEEKMRAQTEEGNALVEKLRRQTEENREKNELLVKQKTLMNDQSASFGPFDRQVVILNENGKGFTLLQNPQAMRLKKAGLIKDRQFVRQPTAEELEQALEAEGPSLGDALQGLFGGGSGGD